MPAPLDLRRRTDVHPSILLRVTAHAHTQHALTPCMLGLSTVARFSRQAAAFGGGQQASSTGSRDVGLLRMAFLESIAG